MKKLILFLLFLTISSPAWAKAIYVRDGGSNATNCTGLTNAVYPGSGTAQNCAFNHPAWALKVVGPGGTNSGTMVAGDTLYIDGDSDTSPGNQAQYMIGYGMPNSSGACSSGQQYNCLLGNIPAGSDSAHHTSIIGTGTHKPMLYGVLNVYQALDDENSHTTLQWLELTDNVECGYNNPVEPCTGPGYTGMGIVASGDDLTWTDVYIHGFGEYGVYGRAFNNATFTRLWVIGNGYGGFITGADGNESLTGTLTFNQPVVEWNGCVEAYPLINPGIDNPLNYKNCFGQNQGGYGDGLAYGATGSLPAGNWTLIGPGSISFNTQDGFDILHGIASTGTDLIDKMRFEGNAGQQIKLTGLTDQITNSNIIADCGWWQGSAQAAPGGMLYGDSCRAQGNAIYFAITIGTVFNFYNNTLFSNGSIMLYNQDGTGNGCNGTTQMNLFNNIMYGGPNWLDNSTINPGNHGGNTLTSFYLMGGSDGNGTGTCGTVVPNENYNLVYNTKNSNYGCFGSNDQCGVVPGFVSPLPPGVISGNESTFYNGWSGVTYMPIASSSPAKSAGENGLSFWNTPTDYYNVTRASPPSLGSEEVNSCAVNPYFCQFNSDCCVGSCVNNICPGSCTSNGSACSINSNCCSDLCSLSVCVACVANGNSCSINSNCCSNSCVGGTCEGSCSSNGSACSVNANCCSNICTALVCVACSSNGNACTTGLTCCSGICLGNSCAASYPPTQSLLSGNSYLSGKSNF